MPEPIVMCWSGGKDSALALRRLLDDPRFRVVGLLTTINQDFGRVSMHGVREDLVLAQAGAIGLPLMPMRVGRRCTNEEYETELKAILLLLSELGVRKVAYGDIFLADLREWREKLLASAGMSGLFPIWQEKSSDLVGEFLDLGFEGRACCVNAGHFDESWAGRPLDRAFFKELPQGVDECGENGEYHSFVFDGPIFRRPVRVLTGERVFRSFDPDFQAQDCPLESTPPISRHLPGFWFCDLMERK